MTCSLVTVVLIALVCATTPTHAVAQPPGGNGGGVVSANCIGPLDPSAILTALLVGHDKYSPPSSGQPGQAVGIAVKATLGMVESVSDKTGSINVVLTHKMRWIDSRLAFNTTDRNNVCFAQDRVVHDPKVLENLSTPEYFFDNEISSFGSSSTFFDIRNVGEVTVRTRQGVHATCIFYFQNMPFDTQTCHLRLVLNAPTALVRFKDTMVDVSLFSQMSGGVVGGTTEWTVVRTSASAIRSTTSTPPGSYVDFEIAITRKSQYWLYFLIVPSVFLVFFSYGSFWIQRTAIPTRAAFCFISFLTVINLTYGALANLPKISPGKVYLLGVLSTSTYFCFYTVSAVVVANLMLHVEIRVKAALAAYEKLVKENDESKKTYF